MRMQSRGVIARFQNIANWLRGDDNLSEINRVFHSSCLIGGLFCLLSGFECYFTGLSIVLVVANFFYAVILAVAYYFSRFRHQFQLSRIISILILVFGYFPILWFYNGGARGSIPYFIPGVISFVTISIIDPWESKRSKVISVVMALVFCAVIISLILIEFFHPEWVHMYPDPVAQLVDTIIGSVFAILGNYMLIRACLGLYYRQLARVNEIAIHDAMTGLYNHIHIVDRLTEEINRVTRSGAPLSIMILDVDHFKQINDTYGHITGDQVITKVSQTIKTNSRSIDLIGRYGGDEILIILPETTAEIAKVSGKRLLEKVRDLEFSRQFSVTCSAGISQFENGDTVDSLIEKADQSLYQAKDAGRDRVYICNPEVN